MRNRIAAYCLFILGLFTIAFFWNYTGDLIPFPWIFSVLGGMMFLAGYLLLRYSTQPKNKAVAERVRQLIADLKRNGDQVHVDFDACRIQGHSYREANRQDAGDSLLMRLTVSDALTTLLDHLDNADGTHQVSQSVIIYQHVNNRTGVAEKFVSPVIAKDEVSLSFYLDQQRSTTLYVDKSNRSLYYFDLDFLSV